MGIEPTTPGFQGMYSEPAVGLYSMGDEVVASAHFSTGIEPVAQGNRGLQTH